MSTVDLETGAFPMQKPGAGPIGTLRAAAALTGAYVASSSGRCNGGTHLRILLTLAAGTIAATGGPVQVQVEETEDDPDGAPTWRPVTRYDSTLNQYVVHSPLIADDGEWSFAVPKSMRYVRAKLKGSGIGGSATIQARVESLGAQQ